MSSKFSKSIIKAINLFQLEKYNLNEFVIYKISFDYRCHCLRCARDEWVEIAKQVNITSTEEFGDNEAAFVVTNNDVKIVLECHETGPEIIAYLALVTDSVNLLKSIVALINTIIKSFMEKRENPPIIRIIKKQVINNVITEEVLIEINSSNTKSMNKLIDDVIKNSLDK